jgi:hypothetical protein
MLGGGICKIKLYCVFSDVCKKEKVTSSNLGFILISKLVMSFYSVEEVVSPSEHGGVEETFV